MKNVLPYLLVIVVIAVSTFILKQKGYLVFPNQTEYYKCYSFSKHYFVDNIDPPKSAFGIQFGSKKQDIKTRFSNDHISEISVMKNTNYSSIEYKRQLRSEDFECNDGFIIEFMDDIVVSITCKFIAHKKSDFIDVVEALKYKYGDYSERAYRHPKCEGNAEYSISDQEYSWLFPKSKDDYELSRYSFMDTNFIIEITIDRNHSWYSKRYKCKIKYNDQRNKGYFWEKPEYEELKKYESVKGSGSL